MALIPFKDRLYYIGISAIYRKGSMVTPEMKTFIEYTGRMSEDRKVPTLKVAKE